MQKIPEYEYKIAVAKEAGDKKKLKLLRKQYKNARKNIKMTKFGNGKNVLKRY